MKTDEIIRQYIQKQKCFTWIGDIAEHTIWGFKNAPYKNYLRAVNKVKKVVAEMVRDRSVEVEPYEAYEGYSDRIYYTGDKK